MLSSVIAFQDPQTMIWQYDDKQELFFWPGASASDFASFDCFNGSCFFKSNELATVSTLLSCNFNSRLSTDYSLESRSCEKCPAEQAFSFGFAAPHCISCESYAEAIG